MDNAVLFARKDVNIFFKKSFKIRFGITQGFLVIKEKIESKIMNLEDISLWPPSSVNTYKPTSLSLVNERELSTVSTALFKL